MEKSAKIYVAGHGGLVGSALVRQLAARGYENLLLRTHAELDLSDQAAVTHFFQQEKPEYVILAAAKVGGIHANNIYPAEFIYQNLSIQTHVIHESWRNNVKRLLFLGSSCIYPRQCSQPIKEEYLLTGPLEPTNRPYALAKIAGIEMCWSYNRQYGTKYLAVMPCNLYGPEDNYHPENSHVIPALIRKFCEAIGNNSHTVEIWGTGKPRREFLFVDDMANACIYLMELPDNAFHELVQGERPPLINVGYGSDQTISELAHAIARVTGFEGKLIFDALRPDGTLTKLIDSSRMRHLGWSACTSLEEGLTISYNSFRSSQQI